MNSNTYEAVAHNCSSYQCNCGGGCHGNGGAKNSTLEKKESCDNCKHFTTDHYCELDLFDPIMANHDI